MKIFKLVVCMILCCAAGARAATVYDVTLDTSALVGHPAGPFSLNFQLIDGDGSGNGNNTAIIQNISFGGGSVLGGPSVNGGASGDAAGQIVITDTSFFNSFTQSFTPGSSLAFQLSITGNLEAGFQPDEFSFAVLDSSGVELPTFGPANSLLIIDIDGNPPQTFDGDGTIVPAAGGDGIFLSAPIVRESVPSIVPEPGFQVLTAVILIFAFARRLIMPVRSASQLLGSSLRR